MPWFLVSCWCMGDVFGVVDAGVGLVLLYCKTIAAYIGRDFAFRAQTVGEGGGVPAMWPQI